MSRDRQELREEPCRVSIHSKDLLKGIVVHIKEVPGGGDGRTTGFSGNPLEQSRFLLPARIYLFLFYCVSECEPHACSA